MSNRLTLMTLLAEADMQGWTQEMVHDLLEIWIARRYGDLDGPTGKSLEDIDSDDASFSSVISKAVHEAAINHFRDIGNYQRRTLPRDQFSQTM